MALNTAFLKGKLAQLQSKGNDIIFKPEEGETTIRIVPLKSDPENPFIQMYFHYNLGGKTYLSPLSYGEPDPIAEFSDALVGEGGLSKDEYKAAKKFYPTLRTYVPVVVRGKEKEGVKFWAFGKQIFEQLLKIMCDDDYGDITDVKEGHDIRITFTPQEKSDTNFAKTEMIVRPKSSVLTDDKDLLKKLLEDQPDLVGSFKKHTYDELSAALTAYVEKDNATPSNDSTPETTVVEKTAEVAPTVVPDEVLAEFTEMFNS